MNTIHLLPSRDRLPENALELCWVFHAQHLLFTRMGDLANAAVAKKKGLLYAWVFNRKRKPVQDGICWVWKCRNDQPKDPNNLPMWLAKYLPDSDRGYIRSSHAANFEKLVLSNSAYMSYKDPWAALEQAALDCPDLEENVYKENACS